jgi:DNA-binding MarR family transcriptional regulator
MAVAMAYTDLATGLRISVMRLSRRIRNQRGDHTLSAHQTAVLGALVHRGPMTPGELAVAEKVQPPSMTRTVAALEALGLVERHHHPTDRRQQLVSVTAAARELIDEDRRRRDAWMAKHLAALSKEERAALRAAVPVLERLSQS